MAQRAGFMQQTLAQFDIEVSTRAITKGPTITRYELHPAPGVKLEKITAALQTTSRRRSRRNASTSSAPVPGKKLPSASKCRSHQDESHHARPLRVGRMAQHQGAHSHRLGKDVYGHPDCCRPAEMPHCLIAGSTGSGKSVCINSIIASLLYRFSPDQLRFVMIDPKVVRVAAIPMPCRTSSSRS